MDRDMDRNMDRDMDRDMDRTAACVMDVGRMARVVWELTVPARVWAWAWAHTITVTTTTTAISAISSTIINGATRDVAAHAEASTAAIVACGDEPCGLQRPPPRAVTPLGLVVLLLPPLPALPLPLPPVRAMEALTSALALALTSSHALVVVVGVVVVAPDQVARAQRPAVAHIAKAGTRKVTVRQAAAVAAATKKPQRRPQHTDGTWPIMGEGTRQVTVGGGGGGGMMKMAGCIGARGLWCRERR